MLTKYLAIYCTCRSVCLLCTADIRIRNLFHFFLLLICLFAEHRVYMNGYEFGICDLSELKSVFTLELYVLWS